MLKSINLLTDIETFAEGSVIDITTTDCKITTATGNVGDDDALKANIVLKGSRVSGAVMLSMSEGDRAKLLQQGSKEFSPAYIFLKS